MEILLIGCIAALAFTSALRRSRKRSTHNTLYSVKCQRAPADKSARSEFRSIAKEWK